MFANKCEGRHTTKNFSHGANYKKNISRRAPFPGIMAQGRIEACQSVLLLHIWTHSTRTLGNDHGRFENFSCISKKLKKGDEKGIWATLRF